MDAGNGKDIADMFMGVGAALLASLIGWFMWDKKRTREQVDDHAQRISQIENQMITREDARKIVSDSVEIFKDDLSELKASSKDISEILIELRLEMAKQKGYKEAYDVNGTSKNKKDN